MERSVIYEVSVGVAVVLLPFVLWWLQRRRARELHSVFGGARKQHRWFVHDGTIISTFCNVCRLPIDASIATCFACGTCVHEQCTQRAQQSLDCKFLTSDADSSTYEHQFVTVNVMANTVCESCQETMHNDAEFGNIRCTYCHITIHRSCLTANTCRCHFGAFRDFIISPKEMRLKRRRGVFVVDKVEFRSDFFSDAALSSSSNSQNSTQNDSYSLKPVTYTRRRPLIVIVNRAAGNEGDGMWLLHRFRFLLNPMQIYDLSSQSLDVSLSWLRTVSAPCLSEEANAFKATVDGDFGICFCVCGGDGTLQHVMNVVERLAPQVPISFVPIPLGTGNDLARQFGWGGGFVPTYTEDAHDAHYDEQLYTILHQIRTAKVALLDRWTVDVYRGDSDLSAIDSVRTMVVQRTGRFSGFRNSLSRRQHTPQRSVVMNNYFSIGLDAAIAFDFDRTRRTQPGLTGARWLNKLWYFVFGTKAFLFDRDCAALHRQISSLQLGETSNVRVPELQCLLFLNIANWCAGCRPWSVGMPHADSETDSEADQPPESRKRDDSPIILPADDASVDFDTRCKLIPKQRVSDRRIEVLGFRSVVHMGTTRINVAEPIRIGQAPCVTIRVNGNGNGNRKGQGLVPVQVDGEPWLQTTPCLIQIRHRTQVMMLKRCTVEDTSTD